VDEPPSPPALEPDSVPEPESEDVSVESRRSTRSDRELCHVLVPVREPSRDPSRREPLSPVTPVAGVRAALRRSPLVPDER